MLAGVAGRPGPPAGGGVSGEVGSAAGTGFAVVPKSILEALGATRSVRQHVLPKRIARNRTFIVWNGEPSPALNGLLALLAALHPDRLLQALPAPLTIAAGTGIERKSTDAASKA